MFEYFDNMWDGYKYRIFLVWNEVESLVLLIDLMIEKEILIDEYGFCFVF